MRKEELLTAPRVPKTGPLRCAPPTTEIHHPAEQPLFAFEDSPRAERLCPQAQSDSDMSSLKRRATIRNGQMMNINVGIIDQQVRGLAQRLKARIDEAVGKNLDETAARSVAFVVLCAKVMLDLTEDEALEALTEGGNDFGVDAIKTSDVSDGEFVVTLFQGKYHHASMVTFLGFGFSSAATASRGRCLKHNRSSTANGSGNECVSST